MFSLFCLYFDSRIRANFLKHTQTLCLAAKMLCEIPCRLLRMNNDKYHIMKMLPFFISFSLSHTLHTHTHTVWRFRMFSFDFDSRLGGCLFGFYLLQVLHFFYRFRLLLVVVSINNVTISCYSGMMNRKVNILLCMLFALFLFVVVWIEFNTKVKSNL